MITKITSWLVEDKIDIFSRIWKPQCGEPIGRFVKSSEKDPEEVPTQRGGAKNPPKNISDETFLLSCSEPMQCHIVQAKQPGGKKDG